MAGTTSNPSAGLGTCPKTKGNATAVVGMQWGDEGKGKLVDLLSAEHDVVVRYNGGANAGHSVVIAGQRYALHLIPAGILSKGTLAVIGNGVVLDPDTLLKELDTLQSRGVDTSGLVISANAHVVMPYHKDEDAAREDTLKSGAGDSPLTEIGTTRRGIGPAYADKVQRAAAVRARDLLRPELLRARITQACRFKAPILGKQPDVEAMVATATAWGKRLAPMIRETTYLIHDQLRAGKRVMFEGANGTLLDVDHGTFPYVTGSSTGTAGIANGAGVPPTILTSAIGVMKAYSTRVGSGPMPTELSGDIAHRIRERGREYGTTTGRPRRVGWLDVVALRYAAMLNGITSLSVMLLDVLAGFETLRVCTAYQLGDGSTTDRFAADGAELAAAKPIYTDLPGFMDEIGAARSLATLPTPARAYLDFIQEKVGVPIGFVSIGPDREQTIIVGA